MAGTLRGVNFPYQLRNFHVQAFNTCGGVYRFEKDESEKPCRIVIIDDSLYEEAETFNVKLTSPLGGRLGQYNTTEVVIETDVADGVCMVVASTP